MAASNADLLRKKKNTFATNLSGSITDSDTSLSCDSLSGVPTDTAVTVTIDRVDANGVSTTSLREDITGVVSGNNLTNLVRGEGDSTAQAHSDNAVVEITWETETWNDMVDWGLVEHAQDGTHTAASATVAGVVELATTAETTTGTATTLAVTPDGLHDMTSLAGAVWFLDEDTMSSNSDTKVPSQQSVKAYVDSVSDTTRALVFIIDGGGAELSTGVAGDLEIPFACTITAATALADQSGSVVVDIWKDAYANYPPTDDDTITASAPVTISTATNSQDSTLTGWTTSISAGDTLRFNVDSVTDITRVTVSLKVTTA